MKKLLPLIIVLIFNYKFNAQFFTKSPSSNFPNLDVSDSDIGDYDDDGDLDIIITGTLGSLANIQTFIYDNDGQGNFTQSPINFNTKYRNGQVKFIDTDNDNDLDIFITGLTNFSTYESTIFVNNGGTFSPLFTNFSQNQNVFNGRFAWDDLNNDGLKDLILTGVVDLLYDTCFLYKNLGNNNFQLIPNNFIATSQGKIIAQDLDNDGDKDIVIGGFTNLGYEKTRIYRNDSNFNFTLMPQELIEMFNGDMQLRNENNDGLIDIYLTGSTGNGICHAAIYHNIGNCVFQQSSINIEGLADFSSLLTADYDNNGHLDVFTEGRKDPFTNIDYRSSLYFNYDTSYTKNDSTGVQTTDHFDIKQGDFENDGDMDLFVIGYLETDVYNSQPPKANIPPEIPDSLNAVISGNKVTLTWGAASDAESPSSQLTYNVYVGTSSGTTNILSPMAELINGFRKVVDIGNAAYQQQVTLSNLPNGTYYWGVQAMDNQYRASYFSPEHIFTIGGTTNITQTKLLNAKIYPNPTSNFINLQFNKTNHLTELKILDVSGKIVSAQHNITASKLTLPTSQLASGIYFIQLLSSENEQQLLKFIKQ